MVFFGVKGKSICRPLTRSAAGVPDVLAEENTEASLERSERGQGIERALQKLTPEQRLRKMYAAACGVLVLQAALQKKRS